ncbi:MAG: S1C family serine protease [Oscillospiraceae bacterium]|nr:S1C family serine protease [Oscillospiraceae bacterium]
MEHFLKDNHDHAIQPAEAQLIAVPEMTQNQESLMKPEKPHKAKNKRFAVAALICLLVVALGIGSGAGGTLLVYSFTDLIREGSPDSNRTYPQFELNSDAKQTDGGKPTEVLISNDTLVINNNHTELTPSQLYELVSDGVVGIEINYKSGGGRFSSGTEETQLVGTGFIFTTDGYILTNHHVIENGTDFYAVVDDYDDPSITHRYKAELIGSDNSTDIAVLKISRDEPFKALPIGDSASLKVGTFVCPIGYPLGLNKSMTFGIVSGLNREFENGGYELSSIQFDAAVNSGNSGGPLFDMYGNVVGIVNKKLVWENLVDNIGLAITIDEAKPVINQLLQYGKITSRPMLGIMNPVVLNEYSAQLYGLDVKEGILVTDINPQAPAYNSELARGDIIIEINGNAVSTIADVQTQIKNKKPGDTVELTVIRFNEAGNQKKIKVEIELASAAELD